MSLEDLNKPDHWVSNEPSPMTPEDLARYQAALNLIVGVEDDGQPRMRIVWGQDLKATAIWDRHHREYRPRYVHKRIKDQVLNPATGLFEIKYSWIGVPRFFFEAYIPPVHFKPEEGKAGVDADGDVFAEVRDNSMSWMTATPVCEHSQLRVESGWRTCCYNATLEGQTCWGRYREPDEQDLDVIREQLAARIAKGFTRPDQKLTDADRAMAHLEWVLESLREKNRKRAEMEYARRDTMNSMKHWLSSGIPGKKGRFSFG